MWPMALLALEPMAYGRNQLVYIPTTELAQTLNDRGIDTKNRRGVPRSNSTSSAASVRLQCRDFGICGRTTRWRSDSARRTAERRPRATLFQRLNRLVVCRGDGKVSFDGQAGSSASPSYLVKGKQHVTVLTGVSARPA